jgi:hypothetical protein
MVFAISISSCFVFIIKERISLCCWLYGVLIPACSFFILDTTKEAFGFQSATIILIWPAGVKAIKLLLQDFNVEMKDLLQNKSVLFFSALDAVS